MRDSVIRVCLAIINFFCVALICCFSGPPETPEKGVLRAFLVIGYFITMIFISKGDDDENNRREDDDVQDV